MGGRDDLCGKMQPLAEIVEPFGCEGVVVPLPGELGLEVAARGKGLAGLDDLFGGLLGEEIGMGSGTDIEVFGVDFVVFGEVVVFFGDEYTLCC